MADAQGLGEDLLCLVRALAGPAHKPRCASASLVLVNFLRLVFWREDPRTVPLADSAMSPRLEWERETRGLPTVHGWGWFGWRRRHWGAGEMWNWRAAAVRSRRSGADSGSLRLARRAWCWERPQLVCEVFRDRVP
jgi:hypothetical protein